jgi:P4 family phage/plasmid primase-like protien
MGTTMDRTIVIKTDKEEFIKFHKLLIQNAPNGYTPFYFKCDKEGKNPYMPAGKWLDACIDIDKACKWLSENGNIGIAGLNEDQLVIIDIDDETITDHKTLKPTLTARSGSRTGVHLFYFEDMKGEIPNIPTDEAGEIRANNQYVIAPGSYVTGYKDNKDNIGKYTVEVAIVPTKITLSDIPSVFSEQLAKTKKDSVTVAKRQAKNANSDMSVFFNLSVHDIITDVSDPQNRFPSIFHASKTGENTSISKRGLIQCWRHHVSMNAQQALCVLSGFLSCQEAGEGHVGGGAGPSLYTGNDEALFHAWKYARENKYIPEEDPPPGRVMRFIAISQKFCKEGDIKDGWKLSNAAYKKTITYLEQEGLKIRPVAPTPSPSLDTEEKANQIKNTKKKSGDVFYLDERGRRCINYETLLNTLLEKHTFKTLSDTEQVLVYEKGIYKDATVLIKGFVEDMLGTDATSYIVREQIGHVQRRFYTDRELFNGNKDYIPVKNGLLNLKTFQLEPFAPDMMYMFKLPGKFDESAPYEATERFFAEVVHEEDISILQEFFGYCLIADLPAHKMMWLIGEGRNGKSTTGNLLKALIGEQNTSAVQLNELDGEHRFSYVEMFGKLLNLVPEPPTKYGLQTPLIKAATGGDTIRGEIKGVQKPINFRNFAKFLIYANEIPRIFDTSLAFWNRTIAVHYPNQFVGVDEMKDIYREILRSDGLSGLLNWAIVGLKRLQVNNYEFSTSKWQAETRKKMERSSQPVETFLDECCTIEDANAWVSKDNIYLAYQEYCAVFKLRVMSYEVFLRNLRRAAPIAAERASIKGVRTQIWKGISLKVQTDNLDSLEMSPAIQDRETIDTIYLKRDMVNRCLNEERSKDSHIINIKGENYGSPPKPGSDINQSSSQAQCELCGKLTFLTEIRSGGVPVMACGECADNLKEKSQKNKKKDREKKAPKSDVLPTYTNTIKNNDVFPAGGDPRANNENFQIEQSKEAKKSMEQKLSETPSKNVSVIDIMHKIEVDFGQEIPVFQIMIKAEEAGIAHDKAEEVIELMKRDGILFSPTAGVVKFVR